MKAAMTPLELIDISKIHVADDRLRPLNEGYVAVLADSIAALGLLAPIAVYKTPRTDKSKLVHGLHRLAAMRRLGWQEAPCFVVSKDQARISEIHENLFRNDLSLLERSDAVIALRNEHEEAHGPITRGGDQSDTVSLWSDTLGQIGERLGVSKRSLARWETLRTLIPELKAILYGTAWADRLGTLTALAKMRPELQAEIVAAVRSGIQSLDEAIEGAVTPEGPVSDGARDYLRATATVGRLNERSRRSFFIEMARKYPAEYRHGLREIEAGKS